MYSSIEYIWKQYKDVLAKVLAENRLANPSLNAEVHLEPIIRQCLDIVINTRLNEDSLFACNRAILETLCDEREKEKKRNDWKKREKWIDLNLVT